MTIAAALAGLIIGGLRLGWCWAIFVNALCLFVVFGAVIWWESRTR
jgi:hypothetical protein